MNLFSIALSISWAFLLALALGACSIEHRMESLQKTSDEMNKKADSLNNTISSVAKDAAELSKTVAQVTETIDETSKTILSVRKEAYGIGDNVEQGATVLARIPLLEKMSKATTMRLKTTQAAMYVDALQFQLWQKTGRPYDEKRRQAAFNEGVLEFQSEIIERAERSKILKASTLDPSSSNNDVKDLFAFAFVIDQINSQQKLNAEDQGFNAVSLLDLFENSLDKNSTLNRQEASVEDVSPYITSLQFDEDYARLVMQMRVNVLMAVAFGTIYKSYELEPLQAAKLYVTRWKPDFHKLNPSQLDHAVQWTAEANREILFLKSHQIPTRINKYLAKFLYKLDVDKYLLNKDASPRSQHETELAKKLFQLSILANSQ